eukprot:CAMPEP_0198122130 /NCGR_PEP_ID=MMETSP1442-20131203/33985_1 /TAXON_ID= /ORGANISM="Craspedostauros australis, Strain CCMP3328" /LENGTH=394 /DNA_ID=CAMNT_0043781085 /DNA_START=212 /DNA_END=1396 /DNA_ORIENTATION=+
MGPGLPPSFLSATSSMFGRIHRQLAVCLILVLLLHQGQQSNSVLAQQDESEMLDSTIWRKNAWTSFPTLDETVEMARLSGVVYDFVKQKKNACESYKDDLGTTCEWYYHDVTLGTQVMIVTNAKLKYIAVVYAGTDDIRTTLEDVDVHKKKFGDKAQTVHLPQTDGKPLVHGGFDNAVFDHGIWMNVYQHVKKLQRRHPFSRLWTTGHSLGAANAVLTSVALSLEGYSVTSINFGCPRIGNDAWTEFFRQYVPSSKIAGRLGIWRVVLGTDIVPRLPDFFTHAGHTIQLWSDSHHHKKDDDQHPIVVQAFYNHYGDATLGYAGVPKGWSKRSHVWNPLSLAAHHICKYNEFLQSIQADHDIDWVSSFVTVENDQVDDDEWVNPPDDVYPQAYFR